jgi:hypothetical protein
MSVELYEQYMEALRRGHVALSRGKFDAALSAYREAADLAMDRATPYTGIGNVHLRQGAPQEALKAFEAALGRTARDEKALEGRAEALAGMGRRTDAARTLDILSEVQEAAGKLADATDTARRALELAEQKARRRHVQDLTRLLRLSGPEERAEQALSKALRLLEGKGPATDAHAPGPRRAVGAAVQSDAGDGSATPSHAQPADKARGDGAGSEEALATHPAPALPAREPGPLELIAQAEKAADSGRRDAARAAYLRAATAFQAQGLLAAALDACYFGLSFAPADPQLHLRLVELYLALDWEALAADKLALLGRLSDLDGHDHRTRARIVSLAADHFPDDPRLRGLSA